MSVLTATQTLVKMTMTQIEKLTTQEYNQLLLGAGDVISTYCSKLPAGTREKINEHLTWIASQNILTITDPTSIRTVAKLIRSDSDLFRFYSQVDFQLFSMVSFETDTRTRLCNNIAYALPAKDDDTYGISYNTSAGDLSELASSLYKNKWVDYFLPVKIQVKLHWFLMSHRHLVLQILIMQYYQLKKDI